MKHYSKEFKLNIIARMLPPNNVGVPQLVKETGISKNTLYAWRIEYRNSQADTERSRPVPGELSSEEKFSVVVETASLNEIELSEYCRSKGLYPEQIQAWRKTCGQANAAVVNKDDKARIRTQAKQLKQLQSELQRKEKALAEAAALLILKKKVQSIWEEPEDEKSSYRRGRK